MKKIILFMVFCILLSGCTQSKKNTIVTWFVSNRMFVGNRQSIDYDKPVQNEYITAYNNLLKEKGQSFQIEVYYIDDEDFDSLGSTEAAMRRIENKYPNADVVQFYLPALEYYENLDSYFNTESGEKLKQEIPANTFLNNQINGKTYGIEKSSFNYACSAYSFLPEYYAKNKEVIEKNKEDPIQLINQLAKITDWNDKQILTSSNGFDINLILEQEYQSITIEGYDTGLFIRRSDRQVVSAFNDKKIRDTILQLAKLGENNAYGRLLDQQTLSNIESHKKYIMSLSPYEYPEELYENEKQDKSRQLVRYGRDKLLPGAKLSILKTSDAKDEAFLSIAFMNIDRDYANAMIYGKTFQDINQIVDSETAGVGGNWNSYGNYLIANQARNEPKNKKELSFSFSQKVNMNDQINPYFNLQDMTSEIDDLLDVLSGRLRSIATNNQGYNTEKVNEEIMNLETQCNEKHINDIISFFQQQLNASYD